MSIASWRALRRLTSALTEQLHQRQCFNLSQPHSCLVHQHYYHDDRQPVQRSSTFEERSLRSFGSLTATAVAAAETSVAVRQEYEPAYSGVSEGLYYLDVATGDLRGAGSKLSIYVQIHGESSSSKPIRLTRHSETLTRGSLRHFEVDVGENLEDVRKISVWLGIGSFTEPGEGWYLEGLRLVHAHSFKSWSFPCSRWLGQSENGGRSGPTFRELIPGPAALELMKHGLTSDIVEQQHQRSKAHPISVDVGTACVPHHDKLMNGLRAKVERHEGFGGDDAYFMRRVNGVVSLGVADGVHEWQKQGIDSSIYSKALMKHASSAIKDGVTCPVRSLTRAWENVTSDQIKGSTTATIVVVEEDKAFLSAANIGDSGLMIISRNTGSVILRTIQQEFEFGCPFQLGHHEGGKTPSDAQIIGTQVHAGDILILGTDGLYDNVSEDEIVNIAMEECKKGGERRSGTSTANSIARKLTALAYEYSIDKEKETPYAAAASDVFNMIYRGGKKDDITVLVAIVSEPHSSAAHL